MYDLFVSQRVVKDTERLANLKIFVRMIQFFFHNFTICRSMHSTLTLSYRIYWSEKLFRIFGEICDDSEISMDHEISIVC